MQIAMDHLFLAPREELWRLLLDPSRLANCIPGCERMQEVAPDSYSATLKIGVASVKGTYVGRVTISDKQPPSRYKLSIEGSGAPGFVKGQAAFDLTEQGERETRLTLNGEAQVGGLFGSVGQRFLSSIARQMIGSFLKNIEQELLAARQTSGRLGPD